MHFLPSDSVSCMLRPSFTFLSFTISFFFLVSFRRFRKAMCRIGYQIRDVSPSICLYGFLWNLTLGIFDKIYRRIHMLFKNENVTNIYEDLQ